MLHDWDTKSILQTSFKRVEYKQTKFVFTEAQLYNQHIQNKMLTKYKSNSKSNKNWGIKYHCTFEYQTFSSGREKSPAFSGNKRFLMLMSHYYPSFLPSSFLQWFLKAIKWVIPNGYCYFTCCIYGQIWFALPT